MRDTQGETSLALRVVQIESEWESGEAREAAADFDVKGVRTPVRNVLESVGVSAACLGLWRYHAPLLQLESVGVSAACLGLWQYVAPVQQCVAKKMCACHHNQGAQHPLQWHTPKDLT